MIRVLQTGTELSIQDGGRPHLRRFGVPLSGYLDTAGAMRANILAGNRPETALFECYLPGQKFEFLHDARCAAAGAKATIHINGKSVKSNHQMNLLKGDILEVVQILEGSRVYLSVSGGLKCTEILGSCSELTGFHSSRLAKGDLVLFHTTEDFIGLNASMAAHQMNAHGCIEVFPGPEFETLPPGGKELLLNADFTVTAQSNRMAYKLKGPNVDGFPLEPMISSPVIPGTVQWLPDGSLVILMRSCQTIGGYPRILQLQESGINQVAQRAPGQSIEFKLIE